MSEGRENDRIGPAAGTRFDQPPGQCRNHRRDQDRAGDVGGDLTRFVFRFLHHRAGHEKSKNADWNVDQKDPFP